MVDISAAIELALFDASEQPIGTTLGDVKVLYAVVQTLKTGGKLNCRALDKAGKFAPFLQALAREAAILVDLIKDPTHKSELLDLTDSAGL